MRYGSCRSSRQLGCHRAFSPSLLLALFLATSAAGARQKETKKTTDAENDGRIASHEEISAATTPTGAVPFVVIGWPFAKAGDGIGQGLVAFERGKFREKALDLLDRIGRRGFRPSIGALGEASGIGLGLIFEYPARRDSGLRLVGRWSPLANYQEFAANYISPAFLKSNLVLHSNYQWRPNEPYYGYGQDSRSSDKSSFALRQSSAGLRWEVQPMSRFYLGTEYTAALLKALPSDVSGFAPVSQVFGDLPGLGEQLRLHSVGGYVVADGIRGDYGLGGRAQVGGSWQDGLGSTNLCYARYEGRFEGRLPIARDRSALVGQAVTELTRQAHGSGPMPFYLYPRIGGSATLRAFPLDRFYGRNMVVTTLEYRYAIHPNIETQLFWDQGQIFDSTADLDFWDWHRSYGIGFRFRNETGTFFRLELAVGDKGFSYHISWGDRPVRRLGGPVRYPLYRP